MRALWQFDDPALVRAGHRGEQWLAAARLRLFLALWLVPLSWLVTRDMRGWEVRVGLAAAGGAVLVAAAVALAARRPRLPAWFGLASGALDVTLVSLLLAAFLAVGRPLAAVNSYVAFEFYFLAIAATALRYDWRVCAVAGVVAVAEYAGIAAYAAGRWHLADPGLAPEADGYGTFAWSAVVGRTVVLALAAALTAQSVARAGGLRVASVRDQLTGAANRAYFDERLAEEVARARRTGRPLALALLDLDHFKSVNDRYGHAAGDAVLRAAAQALRAQVRRHDVLARYGGEEFAVLLVDVDAERAVRRVDALRLALSALAVPLPSGDVPGDGAGAGGMRPPAISVTGSAGVAAAAEVAGVDEVGATRALLHLADERLYAAKALGRNLVVGPGASSRAALVRV